MCVSVSVCERECVRVCVYMHVHVCVYMHGCTFECMLADMIGGSKGIIKWIPPSPFFMFCFIWIPKNLVNHVIYCYRMNLNCHCHTSHDYMELHGRRGRH